MSLQAMAWAWGQELPHTEKFVLVCLADMYNPESGICSPSMQYIAKKCGMDRVTVLRKLQNLETTGHVTAQTRTNSKGHKTSNLYILHLPDVADSNISCCGRAPHATALTVSTVVSSKQTVGTSPHPRRGKFKRLGEPSMDDLHQREQRTNKRKDFVEVPAKLQSLVDLWGEVAVRHGPFTRSLRRGVDALRSVRGGKFFEDKSGYGHAARVYTVHEIELAIRGFATRRNDPAYYPTDKKFLKKLTLADFFYSPHATNGNGPGGGGSLFIECLKRDPKLAVDRDPEFTIYVQDKVEEYSGDKPSKEAAARAASKLLAYWGERERWLQGHGVATLKRLCLAWVRMLNEQRGASWDIGHIVGHGMNDLFERHVKETAHG